MMTPEYLRQLEQQVTTHGSMSVNDKAIILSLIREIDSLKLDAARQRRLLNLKDDAIAMLYGSIADGTVKLPRAIVHAIDLAYGAEEIEAAKARGENPYFAGTTEAGLQTEIDSLAAIVGKLPVYADTGKPFVPGRDNAFVIANGLGDDGSPSFVLAGSHDGESWGWTITSSGHGVYGPAYSTREAALAAKESTDAK